MMQRCAVIGIGQTQHAAKRDDVSMPGLVREAASRALADAGLDWRDIEAVVLGKAPDMFEGVVMPELFLTAALGATNPGVKAQIQGSTDWEAISDAVIGMRKEEFLTMIVAAGLQLTNAEHRLSKSTLMERARTEIF